MSRQKTKVPINVTIDDSLAAFLKRVAIDERSTLSQLVNYMLWHSFEIMYDQDYVRGRIETEALWQANLEWERTGIKPQILIDLAKESKNES